jgi:hypothetical protein
MSRFFALILAATGWCLTSGSVLAQSSIDFNRDVLPILSEKCFHCHGPDASKRKADLRFDVADVAIEIGVIIPGDPDASELVRRIFETDPEELMPPPKSKRTLTEAQKKMLRQWIGEGADFQKHWAFVPPARPELPAVSNSAWVRSPVDRFILAKLEEEGLDPEPAAEPETWFRRVSLDLLGLPPSITEIDHFLEDLAANGEAAYARAVDRILESTHFGERLAIDWLDVSRYADTHGFNNDSSRSMWRWRDWVIDSFNQNLPYDRFLTEQLAGDLLPSPTLDQQVATAFNRNHVISSEGGIINEEYRVEYVADRVRTVGIAWLGLTIECARCHDHKYDPFPQTDYYSLFSFFNNVPEIGEDGRIANAAPLMRAPTQEQADQIAGMDDQLRKQREQLDRDLESWEPEPDILARANELLTKLPSIPEPSLYLSADQVVPLDNDFWTSIGAGPDSAPGVVGDSWKMDGIAAVLVPGDQLKRSPRSPLTVSLWIRPDSNSSSETALVSAIDYGGTPEGTDYGKGFELRLVDGEMVFTLSHRFPVYALRISTEGAAILSDQWTHLTAVFEGVDFDIQGDSLAHRVRLYVNGREQNTRVLNDGFFESVKTAEDNASKDIRIGGDARDDVPGFSGQIDQVRIWTGVIPFEVISSLIGNDAFASPGLLDQPRLALSLRSLFRGLIDSDWTVREAKWNELAVERHRLERSASTLMVMEELPEARPAFVLKRGVYDQPGESVQPAIPLALGTPWPTDAPKNRLGLARWLTLPEHPLTARVVVNRFWQHLFGAGLVRTPEDFGFQGEFPTHPELLDWLAVSFVESGWDVKALFRDWALSSTYRQSSNYTEELINLDPANRLLARMSRVRLPAEIIRDQALALSELLVPTVGGPSVFPFQPEGYYDTIVVGADYPGTEWVTGTGDDLYRRSLYTFWKRTAPHPAMTTFDAPDREFCIARRSVTTTPLQSLVLWNEPGFVASARAMARQLSDRSASLGSAFRLVTGRSANPTEVDLLQDQWSAFESSWRSDRDAALEFSGDSKSTDPVILATWTSIASMLLSLDETVTRP